MKFLKGPYLLGLTTIGLTFSLFGLFLFTVKNLEGVVGSWQKGIQIVCYLQTGLDEASVQKVLEAIKSQGEAEEVRYLPPSKVKGEFLEGLSELFQGLEDLQEDLFPPVVQVSFKAPLTPEDLRAIARRIEAIPGVQEVQYGGKWLERAFQIIGFLKTAVWVLGAILFGITLLISTNTLRLLFYQRKEEVEILRLMGATERFIRTPFVIDGVLQGFLGALFALVLSWVVCSVIGQSLPDWLSIYLPQGKAFSFREGVLLLSLGVLSGLLGGMLACSERV